MSYAAAAAAAASSFNSLNCGAPVGLEHGVKPILDGYKWRLVLAYDGTQYAGWQYQLSPPTVQCTVEKALTQATKLERKDLHLVGASRTDTGVHAWGQVAHFVTPFNYDNLEEIHAALNGLLPSDIRVREISPASAEFHSRFSAKSKIYHYKIYNDTIMDPFQRHFAYHSVYKLNSIVMREAAKYFVGKHDFSAFANASHNDRAPDPVKHIFRFDVKEMGALLQLEVEGSGFLYRQVRNMVALLLQIGKEAVPPEIVPCILASRDRKELAKYSLSAPPHGLCLVSISYNESHLLSPPGCPANSFVLVPVILEQRLWGEGLASSASSCFMPLLLSPQKFQELGPGSARKFPATFAGIISTSSSNWLIFQFKNKGVQVKVQVILRKYLGSFKLAV